jgi:hypothetical protein
MTKSATDITAVAVAVGLVAAWWVHAKRLAALSKPVPVTTSYVPTSNPWVDQTRYSPLYESPDLSTTFALPDYP